MRVGHVYVPSVCAQADDKYGLRTPGRVGDGIGRADRTTIHNPSGSAPRSASPQKYPAVRTRKKAPLIRGSLPVKMFLATNPYV